jgi:large-conductance mechanosensitive channel
LVASTSKAYGTFVSCFIKKINNPANITSVSGATSQFKYGDLVANIIDFAIIALIVFIAYKFLSKHNLVEDKSKPESK